MLRLIVFAMAGLTLLPCASKSQSIITPEQAVQAVRDFWGDQTISGTVIGPTDECETSGFGFNYFVEVTDTSKTGSYCIQATNGLVIYYHQVYTLASEPTIDLTEAQSIAESFLMQHYPAFGQGQWFRIPEEQIRHDSEYQFCWYPILNGYGVRGPYYIEADVDGLTGNIVGYFVPWNTAITGPTVPQITQQQAQQIASPWAFYDLNEIPFSEVVLSLDYDLVGIQRLTYTFRQYPIPTEDNPMPDRRGVCVDAVTGVITGEEWPLGGIVSNKRMRKVPPLPRHVRLWTGKEEVHSVVFPIIEKDRTWIRVELMRGFGVRVKTDRQGATVKIGGQTLDVKQVGAKWRDYGWWIPLRRTVDALGWKVAWDSSAKAAHVAKPEKK